MAPAFTPRSEARTGLTLADGTGYRPLAFSTGGLELNPGGMYLAFLSTHDEPQPGPVCEDGFCHPSRNSLRALSLPPGESPLTPYEGGAMVGSDFLAEYGGLFPPAGAVPLDGWSRVRGAGGPADAQFSATFEATAAPEPASMALLGTGLAGLAGAAGRRRRRRDEQAVEDPAGA